MLGDVCSTGVLAARGPAAPPEGRELCAARPAVPLRTGLGHRLRGPGPVLPSGRHPERAQREDVEGHCRRPGGRPLALGQLHQPPQVTGGGLGGAGRAGRVRGGWPGLVPGGREPGRPTSAMAVGPPLLLGRGPAGPEGKSRAREAGRRSSARTGRPSTWAWGRPERGGLWCRSLRIWERKGFLSRAAQTLCPRRVGRKVQGLKLEARPRTETRTPGGLTPWDPHARPSELPF